MADFLVHKGLRWEYESFGNGPDVLLAFHGFGNHGSAFRIFAPALQEKYSVISFTLPHHSLEVTGGATGTVSPGDLKDMLETFLRQRQADRFSLMGYSLGGKIALQLVELFPSRIDSLYLFAPDGIRPSFSNAFVTRSLLGKKVFQRIIDSPAGLFRLAATLERMKLLNSRLAAFVRESLSTRAKRQMVWDVWMTFRDIQPRITNAAEIIRRQNINVHLFFGKYDRIIPPSVGERFAKMLNRPESLHIVEAGHNLFKESVGQDLAAAIQGRK